MCGFNQVAFNLLIRGSAVGVLGCSGIAGSRGSNRTPGMQRLGQCFQEGATGDGFAQVSDAAHSHGLVANLRRVMRGDENDRRNVAPFPQLLLQLQAGHAAELYVEHQTVRRRERRSSKERLGRRIHLNFKSRGAEQAAERAGKTVIVVHDRDIDFVLGNPSRTCSQYSATRLARAGGGCLLSFGAVPYCPLVQYEEGWEGRRVCRGSSNH